VEEAAELTPTQDKTADLTPAALPCPLASSEPPSVNSPDPQVPGSPTPISASTGTSRTRSDETPSANTAPTEPPVPQTVLPVVTKLPATEEKVPLPVDSSTLAEEALTCAAYNAPALAEAVPSITTSAPLFIVSLPLAPRDLTNQRLCAPDAPAIAEVAVLFRPAAADQAASLAVSPSHTPNSADIVTVSSPPTLMDEPPEPISDVSRHCGTSEGSPEGPPGCFNVRCMDIDQLRKVLKGRQLTAGNMPSVVLISRDMLLSTADSSAMRMVGLLPLLCSGWLSVVELLVSDTPEIQELVEQLLTERRRLR